MEALDNSLKRLGVDCIDLYQLHAPPSNNTIEDYMDIMAENVCVIPIPGIRNIQQGEDNIGAIGWSLTKEERALINKVEIESH